jgi:hemerythrin-like domain-containing protein
MAHTQAHGGGALDFLQGEHDTLRALLRDLDALSGQTDDDERKAELVDDLCHELTVHAMIEEELFYPALRLGGGVDGLVDDAETEHAGVRELVSRLEVLYPGDEHFDTTVTVLAEEVLAHIDKEESRLFDAARACGVDLDELGEQLAARKEELDEDLTAPSSLLDGMDPHGGVRRPSRPPN